MPSFPIMPSSSSVQVFLGNRDDSSKARVQLDRMVSSRFVRVLPHDFQSGIYLRVELLGCATGLSHACGRQLITWDLVAAY